MKINQLRMQLKWLGFCSDTHLSLGPITYQLWDWTHHSVSLSLFVKKKTTPALTASVSYSECRISQGILQTLQHQERISHFMITKTFINKKIKLIPEVSLAVRTTPSLLTISTFVCAAHFLLNIIAVYCVVLSRFQQLFPKPELKTELSPG